MVRKIHPGKPLPPISDKPVAYMDGPPRLEFAGRHWVRGQPQRLGAEELEAMQSRPGFEQFFFTFIQE